MRAWLLRCAVVLCLWPVAGYADELLIPDLKWASLAEPALGPLLFEPPEPKNPHARGTDLHWQFEVGRISFRSPGILGGLAAREGMSCNSCHRSGGTNPDFFVSGLSDDPGTFDATNPLFSTHTDDGVHNPVVIPELFGIKHTAPYPSDGRFETLKEMVDHVILKEFDGLAPPPLIAEALMTYLEALDARPPDMPIQKSVQQDLDEVSRHLNTVNWALSVRDVETVAFLVNASRRHLEVVYNRFDGLDTPQSVLLSWSLSLKNVRLLAEQERFAEAKDALKETKQMVQAQSPGISAHEKNSLYDPEKLRAYVYPTATP